MGRILERGSQPYAEDSPGGEAFLVGDLAAAQDVGRRPVVDDAVDQVVVELGEAVRRSPTKNCGWLKALSSRAESCSRKRSLVTMSL